MSLHPNSMNISNVFDSAKPKNIKRLELEINALNDSKYLIN